MTLPNFLIIGGPKCGTTSLYQYLRGHPAIFMPDHKEPRFFAFQGNPPHHDGPKDGPGDADTVTEIQDYEALFEPVTSETAIGEATVFYLYYPWVAERVRDLIPDARLIALLRNPVERAYSAFMHCTREGLETTSDFREALALEEVRLKSNWSPIWSYQGCGQYHDQLVRYYEKFPRGQIRVYLFEDLTNDPEAVLQDVYDFLEVDKNFEAKVGTRHNATGITRSNLLANFIDRPSLLKSAYQRIIPRDLKLRLTNRVKRWNLDRPPFPEDARRELAVAFRDEITKLEDLIGRDLSHWRE